LSTCSMKMMSRALWL